MSFINDIINRLKNKKTMANPTNKLHFETLQVRVGQEQADQATDSRAVPIYATTAYVFHSAQHASDRSTSRTQVTFTDVLPILLRVFSRLV